MRSRLFWISYDITQDRRRDQLRKLLSGYGVRVQFSAFECMLTELELGRLLRGAGRLVRERDGDSLFVCQCGAPGQPGHRFLGRAHDAKYDFWVT